jgi:hypothetical protein
VNFTLDGTVLGKTGSFKYLGRIMSENDSDWPALQKNLTKARQRWASISRLLGREGATPKVSGYIYKAAILTVLLYGSETWVWSQRMLQACEGFHHRAARRIAGTLPKRVGPDNWVYPPIGETLKTCCLYPIECYIARRWKTVRTYVEGRPIFLLCQQARRAPGTSHAAKLWWEEEEWQEVLNAMKETEETPEDLDTAG